MCREKLNLINADQFHRQWVCREAVLHLFERVVYRRERRELRLRAHALWVQHTGNRVMASWQQYAITRARRRSIHVLAGQFNSKKLYARFWNEWRVTYRERLERNDDICDRVARVVLGNVFSAWFRVVVTRSNARLACKKHMRSLQIHILREMLQSWLQYTRNHRRLHQARKAVHCLRKERYFVLWSLHYRYQRGISCITIAHTLYSVREALSRWKFTCAETIERVRVSLAFDRQLVSKKSRLALTEWYRLACQKRSLRNRLVVFRQTRSLHFLRLRCYIQWRDATWVVSRLRRAIQALERAYFRRHARWAFDMYDLYCIRMTRTIFITFASLCFWFVVFAFCNNYYYQAYQSIAIYRGTKLCPSEVSSTIHTFDTLDILFHMAETFACCAYWYIL